MSVYNKEEKCRRCHTLRLKRKFCSCNTRFLFILLHLRRYALIYQLSYTLRNIRPRLLKINRSIMPLMFEESINYSYGVKRKMRLYKRQANQKKPEIFSVGQVSCCSSFCRQYPLDAASGINLANGRSLVRWYCHVFCLCFVIFLLFSLTFACLQRRNSVLM